jgi:membrane protein
MLLRRLDEDKAMINAAALTYTTLLAMVPLMTVFVSVLAAFPVGDRLVEQIQDFAFQNFVPAAGDVVQGYLQEFSGKAAKLTGPSFLFLVLTSLLMMASIDRAFNDIWRVPRARPLLTKFLVYWAVLTVGPLFMGLSVAVTSYLLSLPLLTDAADNFGGTSRLLHLAPLLASMLAFTLLYALVPLRRVPLRHALAGGVAAAVLFELAKRGFGAYLTYFPTYEAIYGTLATVPIFLVWIYLSWLVTLFGAELAFCLGNPGSAGGGEAVAGERLVDAFALVQALWEAQVDGGSRSIEELGEQARLDPAAAEGLLRRLASHRWVTVTEQDDWVLTRDVSLLRLRDLYNIGGLSLPREPALPAISAAGMPRLAARFQVVDEELAKAMDVPVTELFEKSTATA